MATAQENRTEVLLDLLKEFGSKLRQSCDEWTTRSERNRNFVYRFAIAASLLVLLSYYLYELQVIRFFHVTLCWSLLVGGAVGLLWSSFSIQRKRRMILGDEIQILADQVERLVTTASQIAEHTEQDFDNRLQLDLRLAEAEGALRYYRHIVLPQLRKSLWRAVLTG